MRSSLDREIVNLTNSAVEPKQMNIRIYGFSDREAIESARLARLAAEAKRVDFGWNDPAHWTPAVGETRDVAATREETQVRRVMKQNSKKREATKTQHRN